MAKNRLDYQAQLSRHSHDVSAGYAASIVPGAYIPQYFDILGPGDSIYYRTHMFARMQDVVTAFLGEVDLHIDYFFVPLQMIYTPFGQVFAQTNDFITSLYASMPATDSFPTLEMGTFDNTVAYSANNTPEFECNGKKVMRVLDAFDMNPLAVIHSSQATASGYTKPSSAYSDTNCYNPPVAPWIPCAYHAIFQKYYRNDSLEKLNVSAYNVDQYYASSSPVVDSRFFQLEWAYRPSDYFTDIRVSPIASAVNQLGQSEQFPIDGGNLTDVIYKVEEFLAPEASTYRVASSQSRINQSGSKSFEITSTTNRTIQSSNPTASLYLNAQNIRTLFAVDKFARIYGRADKTYDDQILAHFGIEIPHDIKHDLTHLKHYHMVIQSDPIYGTANVGTSDDTGFISTIGQVGGQGQASLDTDQEKFTAPVHGVFMAIAYVVTKPRYTETFSKLHLCTNRLSLPIPEYDKLGSQPVYRFEGSRYFLQPTDSYSHDFRASRCGWQNRYEQFKRKYNRASLIYEDPRAGEWTLVEGQSNIYAPWVISHQPYFVDTNALATSEFVDPIKFFENPHSLDGVMVRPYVSGWSNEWYTSPWLAFQSDPILTDFMCFAKKVSWMSETGEPDL